jgi:hypothetical protein
LAEESLGISILSKPERRCQKQPNLEVKHITGLLMEMGRAGTLPAVKKWIDSNIRFGESLFLSGMNLHVSHAFKKALKSTQITLNRGMHFLI